MKINYILYMMTFLGFSSLFGQSKIVGYVADAQSKVPIIGAYVYWEDQEKPVFTDVNGYFEIQKSEGDSVLEVNYTGYQKQQFKVGEEKELMLWITKKSNTLEEVEINVKKPSTDISMFSTIKTETLGKEEFKKAACCNLSESFETNATVDVSYSDAVTGTKRIQMLGLSGTYAMISSENIPVYTGNSNVTGLEIVPGQWLESVQLIKGTGSVVNGYQSITGQINTEYKSPLDEPKGFYNVYMDNGLRSEINWIQNFKIKDHLGVGVFLQADYGWMGMDMTKNGFMDNSEGPKVVGMGVWRKESAHSNWESRGGVKLSYFDKVSGQMPKVNNPYTIHNNQNRVEVWNKLGYIFPNKKATSIGFQSHVLFQNHDLTFGNNNLLGEEQRFLNTVLYQSILGNTAHKYTLGISHQFQSLSNSYQSLDFQEYAWTEHNVGVFTEYTFEPSEKFNIVTGLRGDYSSEWGALFTPRVHARYEIIPKGVLRASIGSGTKNPNPFLENIGMFASNRNLVLEEGFFEQREQAWNWGVNFTKKFQIDYRDAVFSVDFYRTDFNNKTVVDYDFSPQEIHIYNLKGRSFANSFMAQFDWEIIKFLNFSNAYRYYQVETEFESVGLAQNISTPKHRYFANMDYEFVKKWFVDLTFNWNSTNRLPQSNSNPENYQWETNAPSFFTLSGQIRHEYKAFDAYVGVQNILNFQQKQPIIAPEDPFGNYFDASLIYAPVFGRMIYFGLKWELYSEKKH